MTMMTAQTILCVLIGLAATVEDLRRRQIPNWIPAAALAGGIALHCWQAGWRGGLASLGGAAGGFVVFLVFYILGGMGGGDVKLMSGFGAVLGWSGVLWASLWTALAGALMALGVIGWRRAWRWVRPDTESGSDSIPYAPAITLGAWMGLVSVSV